MARVITVQTLCDPCLNLDKAEVPGEELPPLPLVGNKPRVLAVCQRHKAEVYDPLLAMVRDYGQIVDIDGTTSNGKATKKVVQAGAGLTCPECGRDDFAAPQGLGAHRFRAHGVTKEQAAEQRAG